MFDADGRPCCSSCIARDTMHQQQWLAVIEELGGTAALPIPNSHPQSKEHQQCSYVFIGPRVGPDVEPLHGRFVNGPSLDGKAEFAPQVAQPFGGEPQLAPPKPGGGAQTEQMLAPEGLVGRMKHAVSGD